MNTFFAAGFDSGASLLLGHAKKKAILRKDRFYEKTKEYLLRKDERTILRKEFALLVFRHLLQKTLKTRVITLVEKNTKNFCLVRIFLLLDLKFSK